jgi:hypothetical protein
MVLRGSASGGVQRKVRLLRHQKVALLFGSIKILQSTASAHCRSTILYRRFSLPRVSRITTRFSICKCDICARIMIQTSQGKNYIE